jgi:hypothetical protein
MKVGSPLETAAASIIEVPRTALDQGSPVILGQPLEPSGLHSKAPIAVSDRRSTFYHLVVFARMIAPE